ncbi:ABC transporter ATP-binding protein [Desulfomonile tiedjei]|uniref:ABC-type multidrug transport system, ATPase component n=1 Tax=Desulfomonile tiedjei (strain ATCC 49306 / DSM 6799 / DCB-1) TaxID=706587 RepID=I4CEQ8_DESTA|nr:ATP-binding cassette domain-containing protein [Desulfomonile tiedjei]AFM28049.1 ABC-type multidrug transport system, ATPase component [Desulfomonile tiedjei DSM 6799]
MIEVMGLEKHYGKIRAVENLSFRIERGSVFGLLGPNGAGKTTTIKMLTTLTKPDAGHCFIEGHDVAKDPVKVKRLMGVVPQENNLDRELTAYENLLIYCMLHGTSDRETKIRSCLQLVDLWDRRDSVVMRFSGGMQRRLLIARSLLTEPSVLFLDEPSIGLDPQIRRQMWDIIRKTRIDGRTVVITTHYIEEAEVLCDQVGILAKGSLIALDTSKNLKATVGEYIVEFVNGDGKLIQRICKDREEAHGVALCQDCSVTIRKSNLEDVFIKLTGERIE